MSYMVLFSVAVITWLFSSRPDLLFRLFATSDDDPHIEAIPKENDFRRSLRTIAVLQALVGLVLLLVELLREA